MIFAVVFDEESKRICKKFGVFALDSSLEVKNYKHIKVMIYDGSHGTIGEEDFSINVLPYLNESLLLVVFIFSEVNQSIPVKQELIEKIRVINVNNTKDFENLLLSLLKNKKLLFEENKKTINFQENGVLLTEKKESYNIFIQPLIKDKTAENAGYTEKQDKIKEGRITKMFSKFLSR